MSGGRGKLENSPAPARVDKALARAAITEYLQSLVESGEDEAGPRPKWHQPRPDQWTIFLRGSAQQIVSVEITLGEYTLQLMTFYMRAPEENIQEVYQYILRRNLELSTVKFGIDEYGDIYMRADTPVVGVIDSEIDRVIGVFFSCADSNYLPIMRLGFASSFKR